MINKFIYIVSQTEGTPSIDLLKKEFPSLYFDNVEKPYADMFTDNVWIDDIIVVDATIRKFYSVLPRVEIILQYQNHLYNKHQHDSMLKRKNYTEGMNINYFGGINNGNNQWYLS